MSSLPDVELASEQHPLQPAASLELTPPRDDLDGDDLSLQDLQAKTALSLAAEAHDLLVVSGFPLTLEDQQLFEQLAENVNSLLAQYTMAVADDSAEREFLSAIQVMYSILDHFLQALRDPKATHLGTAAAFTQLKSAYRKLGQNEDNANASVEISPLYQSTILSEPPAIHSDTCYLHAAVSQLSLWSAAESGCELSEFAAWVSNGAMFRAKDFRLRYGTVQEVHLFRSRKAPFHHEYVLVLLKNSAGLESWLRFERAARRKIRGVMPQFDSARPLFGGVKLREIVSFAGSMNALVQDSDELAEVIMSSQTQPMSLEDLCQHIAGLSVTKPLYKLFSANCRWLARRAFLTIAQWGISSQPTPLRPLSPSHTIRWGGGTVSLEHLSSRLKKEKFGGRDIDGLGGIQLQAYSLAQLAGKYSNPDHQDFSVARDAYHRSLACLEAIVSGIARDQGILYQCSLDGPIDGSLEAALSYDFCRLVDAVPVSVFRTTLPQYLDPYASFLFLAGREHETVLAAQLSVALTRESLAVDPTLTKEPLGRRLIELGQYLAHFLPNDDAQEALSVKNEAEKIWGQLYEDDRTRYRTQYTDVLAMKTDDLTCFNDYVHTEELYALRREVLRLTRESYMIDTDSAYHAPELLRRLRGCIAVAKSLGHHQDALVYCFEANALIKENFSELESPSLSSVDVYADTDWREELITQRVVDAEAQDAAGLSRLSRTTAKEIVTHIDQLSYLRPGSRTIQVAGLCFEAGDLLAKSDDVLDYEMSLKLLGFAETSYRDVLESSYMHTHKNLLNSLYQSIGRTLSLRSSLLRKLGRDDKAEVVQREIAVVPRDIESLDEFAG